MKENTCYDKLINGVNENGTIVFYGKKNTMRAFLRDVDLFAAALKKRYATQLNLYAATAEKLLGKKTAKKILVNLFSGDVAEIT